MISKVIESKQNDNGKKEGFWLAGIKSTDYLKEKFIGEWNWENCRLSRYSFDLSDEIKNNVGDVISIAEKLDSKILHFNITNLEQPERQLKSIERKILLSPDIKPIIDNNIFIFSYNNFEYLDFVNAEKVGANVKIKRFSITPENRNKLRTPTEQLNKLNLAGNITDTYWVRKQIDEAFSVEAVTEKFYDGYLDIFNKIKKSLLKQEVSVEEKDRQLRDFIHQILNRIMFLYFVQKRGCFVNNKNFLADFWGKYKTIKKDCDKFHKKWLEVLFFESLCKPSYLYSEKTYLGEINQILRNAPYLNGGLFEKNDLDDTGWIIEDKYFDEIFEFFESYNFTVEESTPFDIDIAINPEMLGNVYEHLVNTEEQEEQAKGGIFYTPKIEIELMVRRSLVEYLYNKLKINKEKLYLFIFKETGQEITHSFTNSEAESVLKELDEILILDPACGSGHYLVVTTQILYELKQLLWQCLGSEHLDKYEEKKQIIERNIYGNDIKEWAVEIAKLRLWLDLFVDADIVRLQSQHDPLLPNLNFKIRCGDSLVQRIGNKIVPLRRIGGLLMVKSDDLKHLIQRKSYVYESGGSQDYQDTLYLEKKLLLNALNDYEIKTQKAIKEKNVQLKQIQLGLLGESIEERKTSLFEEQVKVEIEELKLALIQIREYKEELLKLKEPPMIWDLAFAEVFAMKNGFDVVIANPPYVRQEKIEDLSGFYSKFEYKEKLIEQTKLDWTINYEGKQVKSPITERFDKKCDLYVYFYLKGLKLLNENGVMCYISSNSWLDVGYGAMLQEILLKSIPIIAVYDNQVKRSFAHADVNTIIAILKAPTIKNSDYVMPVNNDVRFVMFKKQFEEILYSDILLELENNDRLIAYPEGKRREGDSYRLHLINQNDLHNYGKSKHNVYEGNKWGGKYLRAPEIYWKIMEKGKDKLVRLGDIAEVRRGFTTGANEFFYVEDMTDKITDISQIRQSIKNLGSYKTLAEIKKANLRIVRNTKTKDCWLIEEEFLKPVIKSLRECKSILIKPEDLKFKVFMCHKSKQELKGTKALDYIEWGEKEEFNQNPTCKARESFNKKWYNLERISGEILFNMSSGDRYFMPFNKKLYPIDARLYGVTLKSNFTEEQKIAIYALVNSSYLPMMYEIFGRVMTGSLPLLDLKVYELSEFIFLLDIEKIKKNVIIKLNNVFNQLIKREIYNIFKEFGFDKNKPIREQEPNLLPDRKALDDIVFDALGLTEQERKEVYWAVAELVKNRLEKAKSV